MKTILSIVTLAFAFFTSSVFALPVNINEASADEIADALNGVGISKAQAIVAYRKQNGPFENAVDIMQVKGIGETTYEKNRADILVK